MPRTNARNTVTVALVNSQRYGGGAMYSSSFRGGSFYNNFDINDERNRTKYASLLFHELGHAWGDLFDEYNMQIDEPTDK
eukprot:gene25725-51611_t